jgi:hypothetical protein
MTDSLLVPAGLFSQRKMAIGRRDDGMQCEVKGYARVIKEKKIAQTVASKWRK